MATTERLVLLKLSETSLDVYIPSFPGSPRSISTVSAASNIEEHHSSNEIETDKELKRAVDFITEDNEFLEAALLGNLKKLQEILNSKHTNIQIMDHLGRNALHLAVCSGNESSVILLLGAGVNPNVKDNVGMTPLSLCLMRRPSVSIAGMLFDHGAKLVPRTDPMDCGLFLQFAMMCLPTHEEEGLLELLVQKGALVNDPGAPGGTQALHFAAMSNNCALIEILYRLGANIYETNHRKATPYEVAITFKCKEAAAMLEALEKQLTELNH